MVEYRTHGWQDLGCRGTIDLVVAYGKDLKCPKIRVTNLGNVGGQEELPRLIRCSQILRRRDRTLGLEADFVNAGTLIDEQNKVH